MKKRTESLLHKSMMQFMLSIVIILIAAMPLFYWLTKNFYAEDMIDIIEAVQRNEPIPELDLEEDIMQGVMIQYLLISGILGIALIWGSRMVAKRLWRPFDETLSLIEGFRLEEGKIPPLAESGIKEFVRLNATLNHLMANSLRSYRTQKEFTENASHELQTPLAVFQSKLDLLLQLPDLTEQQAHIIQELYQVSNRLSRLNKNLLLLAKMDNKQYSPAEQVDVAAVLRELLPQLECLAGHLTLRQTIACDRFEIQGNRTLLESLINNLVVNAVRHNRPGGLLEVTLSADGLTVANTAVREALDAQRIFTRFYRPAGQTQGTGLGLCIAKAICDYHHWHISYRYERGMHLFSVDFGQTA